MNRSWNTSGGDHVDLADNHDFLYTHIKNLRKKLQMGGCPDRIRAIYGMGYKLDSETTGRIAPKKK